MRTPARLAAGLLVALSVVLLGSASPAAAAGPPPPGVAPIPDLPSNTLRMSPTPSGAWSVTDMWRGLLWYGAQGSGTVATVPKPVTPPVPLTRGPSGQVVVDGLLVGFAIGSLGLEAYTLATGTNPLDASCGSGWEGVLSFAYPLSAPGCGAAVTYPNADMSGAWKLTYGGQTALHLRGVQSFASRDVGWGHCFSGLTSTPAGMRLEVRKVATGVWTNASWSGALTPWCASNAPGSNSSRAFVPNVDGSPPDLRLVDVASGAVVGTSAIETGDPTRTPSCSILWRDGSTTTGAGTPYSESSGVPVNASAIGCKTAWDAKPGAGPGGTMPEKISVDSTADGGAKTKIAETSVPDFDATQKKALDPTLGNGKGLVLEKVRDGVADSCNTWAADCSNWWSDTSEGTVEDTGTDTYRCTFNGEKVALIECGPYRETFDVKTDSPTITDPVSGEPAPWPTTPPVGTTNPTPGEACMTEWGSVANPIEWVLQPIKCALVWAWVPSQPKVDEFTDKTDENWRGSTPGKLGGAIAGVAAGFAAFDDGGCRGLILAAPNFGAGGTVVSENHAFLAACPGDFFAPWAVGFNLLIGFGIAVAGFFAIKRLLDRFVGLS